MIKQLRTKGGTELLSLHNVQVHNASYQKEGKTSLFCGSLPIKQTHDEHCILDRSQNKSAFITQVMLTPTEHEFF